MSNAPGSLLYSLQPYLITESQGGERNVSIYRVGDAKNALDIPSQHTSEDANLVLRIQEAQAILETQTGLNMFDRPCEMLFTNSTALGVDALELSESDVREVTNVYDVSDANVMTGVAFNKYDANGRTYIQRTDGNHFRKGEGLVAKVLAVRGIRNDSRLGHMVRAVMNMLVIELSKGIGSTSPSGFAENPTYLRLTRMITSQTANVSAV